MMVVKTKRLVGQNAMWSQQRAPCPDGFSTDFGAVIQSTRNLEDNGVTPDAAEILLQNALIHDGEYRRRRRKTYGNHIIFHAKCPLEHINVV